MIPAGGSALLVRAEKDGVADLVFGHQRLSELGNVAFVRFFHDIAIALDDVAVRQLEPQVVAIDHEDQVVLAGGGDFFEESQRAFDLGQVLLHRVFVFRVVPVDQRVGWVAHQGGRHV